MLECGSLEEIYVALDSLSMNQYSAAIRRSPDGVTLECNLEDEYFSNLLKVGRDSGDLQVQDFFGEMVDVMNLLSFLRGIHQNKNALMPQVFRQVYKLHQSEIQSLRSCTEAESALSVLEQTHYNRLATELKDVYARTHSMVSVEYSASDYLDRLSLEKFIVSTFTPGHILSYILAKERELHIALMILKSVEEHFHHNDYVKWLSGE
jgi:vacuolar-type H+-ATPase subunit C/Vma6